MVKKKICQPMQPVHLDESGTIRFQENKIVKFLLDWSSDRGMSLNDLARIHFPDEDWEQFAQLIGYSVNGFGELSYVSNEAYAKAQAMADGLQEQSDSKWW